MRRSSATARRPGTGVVVLPALTWGRPKGRNVGVPRIVGFLERLGVESGPGKWAPHVARYSSLSLKDVVCLCAGSDDPEAWQELHSRLRRSIGLTVIRTLRLWGENSQSLAEDLVQETYVKILGDGYRHLRDFAVAHPDAILGYVKTMAANVTHDERKNFHAKKRWGDKHVEPIDGVDPPAPRCVHNIDLQVLLNEIDRCLKRVTGGPDQERDCLIFWLYYRQGMTAKEIAALPTVGLTESGVESALERLMRAIRELIARDATDRLKEH